MSRDDTTASRSTTGFRRRQIRHEPGVGAMLASAAIAACSLLCAQGFAADVPLWTTWQETLTSAGETANPYQDVKLEVVCTGPGGQVINGLGFWDGDKTFRIRCLFPTVGTWTWKTTCSDRNDAGLHGKRGTVNVVPYAGDNPLYKKGYLKISDNKRYLTYASGEPFFWLGDTLWGAFIAAKQDEWQTFLQNRKDNKFNILQVHCGGAWKWIGNVKADRDGNAPFRGEGKSLQWNPLYWRQVDRKVQAANEAGLIVYICAVRQPGPGFPEDDDEQVAIFARNLAARMMGSFVVYSPIADDVWSRQADAAGEMLNRYRGIHLISAHPRFFLEPSVIAHGKKYIDVVGTQPGCGWTFDPYKKEKNTGFSQPLAAQNAIEWPLKLYKLTPVKPVIDQEGQYDVPGNNKVMKLCRSSAYWALLSGASGYTYGCNGVWNWIDRKTKKTTFDSAMKRPTATQMKYLYEFFNSIPWWTLEPAHELVRNQADEWLKKMVAAKSAAGDLAVAYLPNNAEITVDMQAFPAEMTAKWFNPTTGTYEAAAGTIPATGSHTYRRPENWDDALLLLTAHR